MASRDAQQSSEPNAPDGTPAAFVSALLRNPIRTKIMDVLQRHPGMNKHQLARRFGSNINAIEFHVEKLKRAGLIETRASGRGREILCFTSKNADLWENQATRFLLGLGPARQVAVFLAEHPGVDVRRISAALGISRQAVRRRIRLLEEHGLVERLRVDRQVLYHASPQLTQWVRGIRAYEERNR